MKQKSALLAVSFGTSYEEARKCTFEVLEQELSNTFPERKFYHAWTSQKIISKVRETQAVHVDTVREAMERMQKAHITDVLIQPTFMLSGAEFDSLRNLIAEYHGKFSKIRIGAPLLDTENDVRILAEALEEIFADISCSDMLIFMGHGSTKLAFPAYSLLDTQLKKDGFLHFCVGTIEHEPGFSPVIQQVKERKPKRIVLFPLLISAGAHAYRDMAGNHPASWKSMLEHEGAEITCIMKGLGEYQKIRDIYIRHAQNAVSI